MGGGISQQHPEWIQNKYSTIQKAFIPHYGYVTVLRKKQENYDFVALTSHSLKKEILQQVARQLWILSNRKNNPPFLRVFEILTEGSTVTNDFFRLTFQKKLCSSGQEKATIKVYSQLLTFNLRDFIDYRKRQMHQISLRQYAYIIKTCLEAVLVFRDHKFIILQLDLNKDTIFLKTNGEIRILPFRSVHLNHHIPQCGCEQINVYNNQTIFQYQQNKGKDKHPFDNSEKKYIKKLHQLGKQLLSTIDMKIDPFGRCIPHLNGDIILNDSELDKLIQLHKSIQLCRTLKEVYDLLKNINDDYLTVRPERDSLLSREMNNPQKYQNLISQLSSINSFKKVEPYNNPAFIPFSILQRSTLSESDSNTLSKRISNQSIDAPYHHIPQKNREFLGRKWKPFNN